MSYNADTTVCSENNPPYKKPKNKKVNSSFLPDFLCTSIQFLLVKKSDIFPVFMMHAE